MIGHNEKTTSWGRSLRGGVDRNGINLDLLRSDTGRPLRGGVDRNMVATVEEDRPMASPPSRGRGSKRHRLDDQGGV